MSTDRSVKESDGAAAHIVRHSEENTVMKRPVPQRDRSLGLAQLQTFVNRKVLLLMLYVICCALMAYCRLAFRTTIVCTHFAYVPIVLTGMWYGRKSMWVAVFFGIFILCARLLVSAPEPFVADLLRGAFFLAVAFCVGTVRERAEAARRAEEKSRRELEAVQNQLIVSERLASMGQLSAGVAHELNNPLGTVLLYSHMLLKEFDETDLRREDVQMIVSEATRCKNIVRDLLDFARESRVSKTPTGLAPVIEDVLSISATEAEAANVRLTSDVPEDLPTMTIDGPQIKQMLVNVVQNGVDAITGSGEVKVTARLREEGDAVEIKVIDTGCGIPRENLSKLFTPFFTTKEMGKGTGLGLSIAYGIAKMHSGDISAQSEEGKGATFSICLPVGGN